MTVREARQQRRAVQDDLWYAERRLTRTNDPDDQERLLTKLTIRRAEIGRLTAFIDADTPTQETTL